MAGILGGLLGGGGSDPMDIYGDLFTEKQRAALRDQQMTQGLLNAAAVFSKAGQASRLPVSIPWGEAAQALGGSGDEAMNRMLKGMQVAEEVRSSRQKRGFADQVAKFAQGLLEQEKTLGLPQGTLVKPYLAATGGATGGPTTSNAPPPPPPIGSNPSDYGGTSGAPGVGGDPDLGIPPPAKAAGLLDPGGYSGGGLPGQGVLASLGGGGAGVPLPFGQGSPGSPDLNNIRIEQLSGEALPVDAPFPTLANPNKPRSAWEQGTRYDRGDTPFDPARPFATPQQFAAPPSELDRLSQLMKVQTAAAAPGDSRLAALTRQYESSNRNIMQQINATGTAGGYYQITDPTWRDIAPKAGIDLEKYPTAISAPREVQDAAAKALRETRGMQPWSSNKPLMAAVGGSGFSGRVEPLGSDAAPAGAAPAGKIPGLNISPQGLAALNMLSKLGGLGEPFGSLLETYYKSPEYLAEKARTEETSKAKVNLEYGPQIKSAETLADLNAKLQLQPKLEAAIEKAKNDPKISFEERKATIDRYSKELEQLRAAGLEPVDVTVRFPGEDTDRKITITKAQLPELAYGKGIPELGLPPMTGVKMGQPVERPEQLKQQEIDQKFLEEKRQQAESSRRAIMAANDTRGLIEKGVIAGSYADERTRLLKLGQLLNLTGRDDNERIKNTETYIANLGRGMKEGLKGLGPPVSNVDIQIAERIAGGQNLTTQGMLELLKLEEKYHRLALQDYGKLLTSAPKSRYDKSVKEPPTFGAPIADSPEGVAHWWDGKTWRPL